MKVNVNIMKIRIKKLHKYAQVPRYSNGEDDAAVDLHATEAISISPGKGAAIGTGLAFEIPKGTAGLVWDRSGLAFKSGMTTMGGMIDPGYRGEVKIYLYNTSNEQFNVAVGDRVASFIFIDFQSVEFEEAEELNESVRGEKGFGSSGKA
jgi:dUTP pyrophosphatase